MRSVQYRALRYGSPLLLSAALVSSGCGAMVAGSGHCSPKRISVARARSEQSKQLVLVEGHYLRKNGVTRICDAVIASGSPRCAGSGLVVHGYAPASHVKLQRASGTAWTSGTVRIYGLISGSTLSVAGCV